ncbi:MAG: hypothetical protein JSW66_12850 [Phycisphaerales bacterium]|nr:MAG: hypothetical protein JSW66_12850 [Phycisphaerales bacterium]
MQRTASIRFASRSKRIVLGVVCLTLATAVWLSFMHVFFSTGCSDYYSEDGTGTKARQLAARHVALWTKPHLGRGEMARMRSSCAEWDLMARTFFVLALTNMSLREPDKQQLYLDVADRIIGETIRLEAEEGIYHFLMDYGQYGSFVNKPARSLFLDGEIALMLGARQMVKIREDYRPLLSQRVDMMIDYMSRSSVLSAESYPDECWTFCNSVALAAMTISDVLDGRNHSDFCSKWVETAKGELVDPQTGILYSSYTLDGVPKDGPEGSTVWMVSHCLQLVDEEFAKDQYIRAKRELARSFLGFGFAREWPESWKGPRDIDAGQVIPVLQASPSSSGLAFVAARSFGDTSLLKALLASLQLGGFSREKDDTLTFYTCNQLGEAVLLYSMATGPIWQKVKDSQPATKHQSGK